MAPTDRRALVVCTLRRDRYCSTGNMHKLTDSIIGRGRFPAFSLVGSVLIWILLVGVLVFSIQNALKPFGKSVVVAAESRVPDYSRIVPVVHISQEMQKSECLRSASASQIEESELFRRPVIKLPFLLNPFPRFQCEAFNRSSVSTPSRKRWKMPFHVFHGNLTFDDVSGGFADIDNCVSHDLSRLVSVNRHFANPQLWPKSRNKGLFHQIPLAFYRSEGSAQEPNLQTADRDQHPAKYQVENVSEPCPYRNWGKFSDIQRLVLFIVLGFGTAATTGYCGCVRIQNGQRLSGWVLLALGIFVDVAVCVGAWTGWRTCLEDGQQDSQGNYSHSDKIVPRKYLTPADYWGTVISMANVLSTDKQIAVIGALTEGSSIRSIERMTGVHRDTIMRLGVKVGTGCARLMDSKMHDLSCTRLELDEIWGFVGKKERNVRIDEPAPVGNVWTWCAIDADTKLVPAFKVGDRGVASARAFVSDVAGRMRTRVQISTDGLRAYVDAIEGAFGSEVDYAQIVKTYGHEEVSDNRRYSAPDFVSSEKKVITGNPDQRLISTSYVERLNATTRLHMRRLTRLTLAFSKKRENFEAAVALHFAYYNFVKRHNTLRCTPAMAAGVERDFWSVGDLVEAAA